MSDDGIDRQRFDAAIIKLLKTPPESREQVTLKAKRTRKKRKSQARKSA
jgi:hypothetical protein